MGESCFPDEEQLLLDVHLAELPQDLLLALLLLLPLELPLPMVNTCLGAGVGIGVSVLAQYNQTFSAAEVPIYGVPGTKQERTFIAIKPDGVQRGLIGEIVERFERRGYKLVGLKMLHPTLKMAQEHYIDLKSKPFYPGLCKYFSSGPIVAMVWEGSDVILQGRKLVGATNPNESEAGSIRGDLCISVGRNIIHGSDGPDSAQHEISFWFKQDEVSNYSLIL